MPVLLRPSGQRDATIEDEQVAIGWRDQDAAGLEGIPLDRMARRQRAGSVQDGGEGAAGPGGHMEHDQDTRGKVRRQGGDEVTEGFDAPGRGSHHDQSRGTRSSVVAPRLSHPPHLSGSLDIDAP